LPDVTVEAPEFVLHDKKSFCVLYRRFDFQPIAYDTGIAEEFLDFARVVASDFAWIEVVKGSPVILALLQNGDPAQARLCTFEDKELEEQSVVVHRYTPFMVMVRPVQFPLSPGATFQAIGV
jgi:hypothetical protein